MCIYSRRIPNFIYYFIFRDLLDKTSILLCKILRGAFRKHMLQHDCQVAAHVKSESKHLQGAPTKPWRRAWPRCHLHDWARGSTSPWRWQVPCASWACWEPTGKGPRGNLQCFSPDQTPLQKIHRHFRWKPIRGRDFSLNCYRLNTIAVGKCSHFFDGCLGSENNISHLETCLRNMSLRYRETKWPPYFQSAKKCAILPVPFTAAVLLQPGTTDKWQHVRMKI